eukprot:1409923-Rhodomonas_salina.1
MKRERERAKGEGKREWRTELTWKRTKSAIVRLGPPAIGLDAPTRCAIFSKKKSHLSMRSDAHLVDATLASSTCVTVSLSSGPAGNKS